MERQSSTGRRSIARSSPWWSLLALAALGWTTVAHGEPAGTWTAVPPQVIRPLARTGHSLVTFDGAGWLYGGRSPSAGGGSTALTDLWEYKASTGKFSRLNSTTPVPPARSGHAAAASGIYMYLFFGAGDNGALLDDVWYYDDFRHCWEERHGTGSRPAARIEHSAVVTAANQYLVFGGRGGDGSALLADLWGFNSLSGAWQQLAELPAGGRYGHAAVSLGRWMYVLGGTSATGVENDVWGYDPGQNAWTEFTSDGDVPGPFTGSAAAAGDFGGGSAGQILLVGGRDANGADLGAAYSITVDPVNHLAHWTRVTDHSAVFQAAAAGIARPAGRGMALDLLLFGGSASGNALDTASIYSTYVAPPPGPDLTGTWLSQKATSKGTGSKIKWTLSGSVQAGNQGTVKSGACSVRFLLSTDAVADAGDTVLKTVKLAALNPGKTKSLKWSFKLPTGQNAAGKSVIAVIDALGQVAESNEANNSLASAPF